MVELVGLTRWDSLNYCLFLQSVNILVSHIQSTINCWLNVKKFYSKLWKSNNKLGIQKEYTFHLEIYERYFRFSFTENLRLTIVFLTSFHYLNLIFIVIVQINNTDLKEVIKRSLFLIFFHFLDTSLNVSLNFPEM